MNKPPSRKSKKKGTAANPLEPILEESKVLAGSAVVPYKPNQTLTEQRAKKNEALKKRVL